MGFLTRALGRHVSKKLDAYIATPDGQAALELGRSQRDIVDIAEELAGSGLDDTDARVALRERLPDDPEAAGAAIEYFGALRTDYLTDRAYRLLTAAVVDVPVRPIDPAVRDEFVAERELGPR